MNRTFRHYKEITPTGGTGSFNTEDLRGVNRQFLLSSATSSTTYDFTMVDDKSITVLSQKGCKGIYQYINPMGLFGKYTITITNASVDELFKWEIRYEEVM